MSNHTTKTPTPEQERHHLLTHTMQSMTDLYLRRHIKTPINHKMTVKRKDGTPVYVMRVEFHKA